MVKRTGSAYRRNKNENVKNKKYNNCLQAIASSLSFIGKPFYYSLLLILYGSIFFLSGLKKLNNSLLSALKQIHPPKIILQKFKIKLPQFKFSLPKISFPKTHRPKIKILYPVRHPLIALDFIGLLAGIFLSVVGYYYLLAAIFKDLPSPQKLSQTEQSLTTKIYDRQERLLYKIYRGQNRTPIRLNDLPVFVKQATIAIEDKEFYHHKGLSLRGILRAAYQNLFQGEKTGGSTITQQLVKNTLLNSEKTWRRKIKEAILALLVEKKYSKDQILEMYLNQVGYGGEAYGIEEASQKYFGKQAKNLDLAEASLLAGLPASPTLYSPFGPHPENAQERQSVVLRRMFEDGYLSARRTAEAQNEKLKFAPQVIDIKAPHFVMYVKELLVQKYGEKMVENGGLEVTTSLDLEIQEGAQKIVNEEIKKLGDLHITNGAALVTNPKTGEILAMVGSKDYFAKDIDGNFNVTTALRQPGSSIKPVNYSVALENGFTPATLLDDSPITYYVPGQPPYSPINYDRRFHGQVTLRVALASSYNVPAVKVLSSLGVKKMLQRGKEMGITSWNDPSKYGLSLTLGGGEVKMTDLAVAYGVLTNSGIRVNLNPILAIKDSRGKNLLKDSFGNQTPVLNPGVAFLLTNILSDNKARTPAFGPSSQLSIPNRQVAVKTGTTQNLRDNWTIGYTPSRLVAVWVGNNDNTPMSYVASGVTGASPIWRKIMDKLLENSPAEIFPKPDEVREVEICVLTGTLPCDGCPSVKKEFFLSGTEPGHACSMERIREILEKKPKTAPSPQIL